MKHVFTTPRFDRRLKLFLVRHPELHALTKHTMSVLASDKYPAHLKLHKLGGVLKGTLGASFRMNIGSRSSWKLIRFVSLILVPTMRSIGSLPSTKLPCYFDLTLLVQML